MKKLLCRIGAHKWVSEPKSVMADCFFQNNYKRHCLKCSAVQSKDGRKIRPFLKNNE